jgi:hypothetical protein
MRPVLLSPHGADFFFEALTIAWRVNHLCGCYETKDLLPCFGNPGHGFRCKLLISIRYVLCSNP